MKKILKNFVVILNLLIESITFAFASLKGDKFRTFLSLLGVSIGIFSIVVVFSAVDALQSNVRKGFESFSSDVIYLQRFPFTVEEGETEYRWWDYMNRAEFETKDYLFLKENAKSVDAISFVYFFGANLKRGRNSFEDGYVAAVTYDWDKLANLEIETGRYLSPTESTMGSNVVILGSDVYTTLFGDRDAINSTIKIGNKDATVIGVFKKAGSSMVSIYELDNSVLIPFNFGKSIKDPKGEDPMIALKAKAGVSDEEFTAEIRTLLRAARRVSPKEKDDFSINKISFLLNSVGQVFSIINLVGWVIGSFSLLIGGFGIANIMFVSVKERTNMIGIQKAIGAKKYVILTQFLTEAAVLALAGGALGIGLVYIITLFTADIENFPMTLSFVNILKGLLISVIIGVVSGLIPAYIGASLRPVEAINSK